MARSPHCDGQTDGARCDEHDEQDTQVVLVDEHGLGDGNHARHDREHGCGEQDHDVHGHRPSVPPAQDQQTADAD